MKLVDIYTVPEAIDVLWHVLSEREQHQSISHQRMPSPKQHREFIEARPYKAWYLVDVGDWAGAVYLSKQDEIGIGILRAHRNLGYAGNAIRLLVQKHPGPRFLANIAPANTDSRKMFHGLGFKEIQSTWEYRST